MKYWSKTIFSHNLCGRELYCQSVMSKKNPFFRISSYFSTCFSAYPSSKWVVNLGVIFINKFVASIFDSSLFAKQVFFPFSEFHHKCVWNPNFTDTFQFRFAFNCHLRQWIRRFNIRQQLICKKDIFSPILLIWCTHLHFLQGCQFPYFLMAGYQNGFNVWYLYLFSSHS